MYESDEILQTEDQNSLEHHGIKGQKWGQRRFQNPDGSYTELGKERRRVGFKEESKKEDDKSENKAEQLPDIKIGGKAYKDMTKKELRAARKRARHNEAERRAQREFNRDKREAIEKGDISFISKNISRFTNQEIDDAVNRYKKMQNVWAMDKANKKDADYYLDKTIHYLNKAGQVTKGITDIANYFNNASTNAANKRKAGYQADQEYYKSLQEEYKALHPDTSNKNDGGGKKDKSNKDSGTQKGVENEKKALQELKEKDKSKKKDYNSDNLLTDEEKLEIHEREQEKHQKRLDKIARKEAKREAKLREKEEREAEKERERQYEEDLDRREAEAKEYKSYKERMEKEESEAEEVSKRNREQQEREYKEYKERQEREEREAAELQKRLRREEQERKEREEREERERREAESRERRLQEEARRREEEDRKRKQEDFELRKWVDSSPEYQKEHHKEAEKALQDNWWDLMYSGKKKEGLLGSFFSKKDKDKYKDYKDSDRYKKLEEDLKELNSKYLTNLSTAYSNQKVGSASGSRRANKYNKYPSNNVSPKHIHSVQDEKWSKQMKSGESHKKINDWIKDMTKKYQVERGMSKAKAKEYAERYVDAWLEAYDEGKV